MSEQSYPADIQDYFSDRAENLKVPPHSIQGEQSVLGGLMLDNSTWDRIADQVVSEDFYRKEHRLIFDALSALADQSQPFDVVTLAEALERRGDLEEAGGLPYLVTLAEETPSAAILRRHRARVCGDASADLGG
jgi:replicative DNA helicase